MHTSRTIFVLVIVVFSTISGRCQARGHGGVPLKVGYYQGKCISNDVEAIVAGVVSEWFKKDPTIAAALLRIQFHDCFVTGCDASLLLDGSNCEKNALPNKSVRGYDLIDAVKEKLEATCPGVVSCSDIISMATRDAVALSNGERYIVQTGRRDGTVSFANHVHLPSSSISVSDYIKVFGDKGLNITDMVYLMGGHTVGISHCFHFAYRIYDFKGTGKPDPTIDPALLTELQAKCPQKNSSFTDFVNLNQTPNSTVVDNSYYTQILKNRGILQIDHDLALDPQTRPIVESIANSRDFPSKFGAAMAKLGGVGVLTGSHGEIRRSCRSVNSPANVGPAASPTSPANGGPGPVAAPGRPTNGERGPVAAPGRPANGGPGPVAAPVGAPDL